MKKRLNNKNKERLINFFLRRKKHLLTLVSILIIQSAFSQTATAVMTQIPCDNDGVCTITTSGFSLPITYTYYVNDNVIVHSNINSTTDQLSNIAFSTYNVINCLVSGGGVSQWVSVQYTQPFNFTISANSAVCPSTMGTLSATQVSGTTGPFSFSWTNPQTLNSYQGNNISVPVGEYIATITDLTTGCVLNGMDSSLFINQQSNVVVSTSSTQANCTNGTATANVSGGIAPYTYLWSNGATTATIGNLVTGSYSVEVIDAQGCIGYGYVYVQQSVNISANTVSTDATCLQNDGSSVAFGSGGTAPYTYEWSNGQMGNTATGLSGETSYTLLVTDANGCIGVVSSYVNTNTPINVTYTSTPSQCTSATGSAVLNVTGGVAPYTYEWLNNSSINGNTISNVEAGNYLFEVTDANGCIRSGNVVISQVSVINIFGQGFDVTCPNTIGNAQVNVSGSNPPFTYLWSNGATTSQINGVNPGVYSCTVTDALGCTKSSTASIASVSPINLFVSTTPVSCAFYTDGTANAIVSGGAPPYTYSYSTGASSANVSGLAIGNYVLTVTDANGCSKTRSFKILDSNASTSCYCTISGNVYYDMNSDCVYDSGETGIEGILIQCSGYGYTYTDVNGFYSFQVPSGTYTITEHVKPFYPLSSCQSNNNSVSVVASAGCNNVVDFGNDIIPIVDLQTSIFNSTLPPIPGNNYQQKVIVQNIGTTTETDIQVGYEHDGQLSYVSSNLASFQQPNSTIEPNYHAVQSGFPSLSANETQVMLLNYYTPTNIPIGTSISFIDSISDLAPISTNWLLDNTPWNNIFNFQTAVIGSYDPNYKEVSPKGEGEEGFISSEVEEMNYTIHFQNEGNYFAQKIVITDQLDSDLDWSSLRPGYSDYSYTTTISETGLVTFTFEDIYLPWKSSYGDALSSGLVNYSIRLKDGIEEGAMIENNADIYFDYNAPIRTNTTINTIESKTTNIEDLSSSSSQKVTIKIYPVPAKNVMTIELNNVSKNEEAIFKLIDMMGNIVKSNTLDINKGTTEVKQSVSNLPTGTYFTRIQFSNGESVVKKIFIMNE